MAISKSWIDVRDRKGHKPFQNETIYCRKIVTALSKTIEIQKEIDELYPEVERSLI